MNYFKLSGEARPQCHISKFWHTWYFSKAYMYIYIYQMDCVCQRYPKSAQHAHARMIAKTDLIRRQVMRPLRHGGSHFTKWLPPWRTGRITCLWIKSVLYIYISHIRITLRSHFKYRSDHNHDHHDHIVCLNNFIHMRVKFQNLIHASSAETIMVLFHWPLYKESNSNRWFLCRKDKHCENCTLVMR